MYCVQAQQILQFIEHKAGTPIPYATVLENSIIILSGKVFKSPALTNCVQRILLELFKRHNVNLTLLQIQANTVDNLEVDAVAQGNALSTVHATVPNFSKNVIQSTGILISGFRNITFLYMNKLNFIMAIKEERTRNLPCKIAGIPEENWEPTKFGRAQFSQPQS